MDVLIEYVVVACIVILTTIIANDVVECLLEGKRKNPLHEKKPKEKNEDH
jgi:hypothetical protein